MCVIILKTSQQKLDDNIIAKALAFNPDGFGMQMLDTGTVHRTMDIQEAAEYLRSERPFIAHARLTTRGKTNLKNTHPFKIDDDNWLFHNGTVATPPKYPASKPDSQFVAETLATVPWKSWRGILSMSDSRFAWTRKTKSGKVFVNRTGTWFNRDGVFYSKNNVLSHKHLVAVYGTLRQGYGNHHLLYNAQFLESGYTVQEYPMVCTGIPYVREEPGKGYPIRVEVYAVNDDQLKALDSLEGHPDWYYRKPTEIRLDNGLTVTADLYFNPAVNAGDKYYSDYEQYRKKERQPTLFDKVPMSNSRIAWDNPYEHDDSDLLTPSLNDDSDLIWDDNEQAYFNFVTGEYVYPSEHVE